MTLRVRTSHLIVLTIAALALVAGVGAAGAVAGAKWIDGKQIEKNSIPADRLEKATLTGKQMKKGGIAGNRITRRTLSAQAFTTDAVEELQPTVEYVEHTFTTTTVDGMEWVAATCPTGTQAVGGYIKPGRTDAYFSTVDSYIDAAQNAYMLSIAGVRDRPPGQVTIQTICLR